VIRSSQRVAIVTGAGNGLGRAYALNLAARGICVLVNNRRRAAQPIADSSAQSTVDAILAAGGEAVADFEDVAQTESGERIVQHALDVWGRLDILVNNAGVGQHESFHKIGLDAFREIFDVNFYGSVYVTHSAFPRMREAGFGRVVFTTSSAGLHGLHGLSAYAASKAAVIGLMRTLAAEGSPHGVLVNAIAPYAATKMTAQHANADSQATLNPELVAPMVAYLVSEQTRLNGEVLVAGKGGFRRAAMVEGPGFGYREAARITPEQIAHDLPRILDMTASHEHADGLASFKDFFNSMPGVT
jgi:NAD(P)-dependent dehydrogenase (short-subunit alcohol dehydrogenase family)